MKISSFAYLIFSSVSLAALSKGGQQEQTCVSPTQSPSFSPIISPFGPMELAVDQDVCQETAPVEPVASNQMEDTSISEASKIKLVDFLTVIFMIVGGINAVLTLIMLCLPLPCDRLQKQGRVDDILKLSEKSENLKKVKWLLFRLLVDYSKLLRVKKNNKKCKTIGFKNLMTLEMPIKKIVLNCIDHDLEFQRNTITSAEHFFNEDPITYDRYVLLPKQSIPGPFMRKVDLKTLCLHQNQFFIEDSLMNWTRMSENKSFFPTTNRTDDEFAFRFSFLLEECLDEKGVELWVEDQ